MEDHSQAISFANSYFSLIDGLAPGLENHLAKDVVLDWFGRTIRGRENVTEFIKSHKIGSRHVFNNIIPVNCINYRKSHTNRKIQTSKTDNSNVSNLLNEDLNFDKLSIEDPENNNVLFKDCDFEKSNVLDFEGNKTDEISMTYELRENDLKNLFTLKISPTKSDHGEKIDKSISEIKNAGRKFTNRQIFEMKNFYESGKFNSDIKYVEANGQIEFSKKSNKRGTDLQTWRRQSKLQIAYSLITSDDFYEEEEEEEEEKEEEEEEEEEFNYRKMETDDSPVSKSIQKTINKVINRLPSLEEITDISNNLIPNINNFGGYLPSFDIIDDRNNFLENFNAELSLRNSTIFFRTPQYVDNRLIFTEINDKLKPTCRDDEDQNIKKYKSNEFVFNYLIHLIVYQGSSKCRRSLSQEFESTSKNIKRSF